MSNSNSPDPSILHSLHLSFPAHPSQTKFSPCGTSGFTSTYKLSVQGVRASGEENGKEERKYFVKMGKEGDMEMLKGEHLSLSAIHNAVPSLCPASFAHGNLSNTRGTFLITEYLDTKASEPSPTPKTPPLSLAQKLAQLHSTPAPPGTQFGFPVATYCGSTAQENNFTASWADFYAERRIRAIGRAIKANHGGDSALESLIEKTAGKVVPRLLGGGHLGGKEGIKPVLVHGDLWSGNVGRGRISGRGSGDSGGGGGGGGGAVEQIIFDPSSCYAHSEYELGIMRMFGGFSSKFFNEYHGIVPKTEPVGEYEDRIELYELYHHLNHYAIFGGGYKHSAVRIMKRLGEKFGG